MVFILVLFGHVLAKSKQEKEKEFFDNERKEDVTEEMNKRGKQDDTLYFTDGVKNVIMKSKDPGLFENLDIGFRQGKGRYA